MFVPAFLALWWPKIDRKSGFPQLFAKTVGSIHFIPGIYTYGVSLWTPIDFTCSCPHFWPSGGQKLTENRGFRNFSRKLSARFMSSLGFILMGYGPQSIFVFVPSFLALWWPKIDRKSGFPQLLAETVGSINFIPGIYTYGVSLWTPIDFTCSCPHFWPSGGQKLTENRGFRNFSRKLSARFISSLGFILMGYGPQSIFVFVPSFLALWWPKIDRKSGFPQLFAETVGSINFIPGIYTYGVSLWTPIDFRVRALIFGPLVAKN